MSLTVNAYIFILHDLESEEISLELQKSYKEVEFGLCFPHIVIH